jgi:hypothetical protein
MATKIGSLLIRLGLDSGEFKSGLTQSERELRKSVKRFERLGGDIQNFGAKLSVGITAPFAALGAASVKGFIEQEKAMADVSAALASMGNVSGKTAGELAAMADKLEMTSLFDAEVILKQVTAQLLTFGNVAGKEFDRAQQAAIDMATRLGGEPQAAAIMLGKALNDPVKGITALTRVGVQFTEQQKAQIAAMQAVGDTAGAQGVILAEVERQFKGAGAAAADASPWRQAEVAIGQAMDKIGEAILPLIPPITAAIVSLATAFTSLPAPVQEGILVFAGVAAALGPVLIALGSLVTIAPAIASAFTIIRVAALALMTNPVILGFALVLGAIYLAWKNWDKITEIVQRVYQGVKTWLIDKLGAVFERLGRKIKAVTGFFFDMYDAVVGNSYVPDMVDGIAAEMARLDALMVDPARKATADTKQAFRDMASDVQSLLDRLFPQIAKLRQLQGERGLLQSARDQGIISPELESEAQFRLGTQGLGDATVSDWLTQGNEAADVVERVAEHARNLGIELGKALQGGVDKFAELKLAGGAAFNELGFQLSGVLQGAQSLGDALSNLLAQLADMAFNMAWKALGTSLGIPGFATGTLSAPRGLAMVGERGPELVNFRGGERVFDNSNTQRMMGGGGGPITINISAPNERVGREAAGQAATRLRHVLNAR